jgi:hypothetical protein
MTPEKNGKVTLQKLYDEIIPLLKDMTTQQADIANIKEIIGDIKDDLKCKISAKAFGAWLGSVATIVGIIITIIALR